MGIFSRLNRVIKSNLNALIDTAEDPEKMIGQTIDDMQAGIKKAKRELVQTLGNAKRLTKKADELDKEATSWEEKAVMALKEEDEALAREALRRKTKSRQEADRVRQQADQQTQAAEGMKDSVARFEEKIDELKSRKTTLASEVRRSREAPGVPATSADRFGSETFSELERMAGSIDQLDAEVEVQSALDGDGMSQTDFDARFHKLEKSGSGGKLDDELAELKKKLDL